MPIKIISKISLIVLIFSFVLVPSLTIQQQGSTLTIQPAHPASAEESDQELHDKYVKYLKYKKYSKYKKAKEKYGFETSAERRQYKELYKLYKSNPTAYARYYEQYKRYKKYKSRYKEKYGDYAKYKKYYEKKSTNQKYGKSKYKDAYNRYRATNSSSSSSSTSSSGSLGPYITVGILSFDKSYSKDHSMRVYGNRDFNVKNNNGDVIATVAANTEIKVNYAGDGQLHVYQGGIDTNVSESVSFDAADGNNAAMVFNLEPKDFENYRGTITIRYHDPTDKVWAINTIPLEHYTWGMGEITGTGDMSYNRVMTIVFRTYGYWKIKYSTKYASQGFKVDATAGDQIYYGYDWENSHTRIRDAAQDTRGKIVTYDGDVAITPYSSSTDGRTRSWEERWGSTNYPYCKSVPDPYGKVDGAGDIEGNHMVGLSARGALVLASDHGWDYAKILKYYYTGIDIDTAY